MITRITTVAVAFALCCCAGYAHGLVPTIPARPTSHPSRAAAVTTSRLRVEPSVSSRAAFTRVAAVAAGGEAAPPAPEPTRKASNKTLKLAGFLALWYFFNAGFNVTNKQLLNVFPYPWVVSWFQLVTGIFYILPAWFSGFRPKPIVDRSLLLKFLPICLLHAAGHASQVASMGTGTVFMTHVIKASEPIIGTLVLLAFKGVIAPWSVNICLLPIVGGVAYAAIKPGTGFDISGLWGLSALLALASTIGFAIAKLLAKDLMTPELKKERKLDPGNNYAVLTCCSAAVLFLPSMIVEGAPALAAFQAMDAPTAFLGELLRCGMFYYAYNEMGFRVLDLLSPISQAVANSAKRVVILLAAVFFLRESVSQQKIIGSAIAIGGVTLYSIAKTRIAKKQGKVVATIVEKTEQPGTWQP